MEALIHGSGKKQQAAKMKQEEEVKFCLIDLRFV
jgi:hypothetical protein